MFLRPYLRIYHSVRVNLCPFSFPLAVSLSETEGQSKTCTTAATLYYHHLCKTGQARGGAVTFAGRAGWRWQKRGRAGQGRAVPSPTRPFPGPGLVPRSRHGRRRLRYRCPRAPRHGRLAGRARAAARRPAGPQPWRQGKSARIKTR